MMMMILGCSFCKVLPLGSCGVSLRAASCQTLIADLEFAVPQASGHKQRYPHKSLIVYKSAIRSKRILDESYAQQFAACMYLCSTLPLAWGGKFCCCQSLIDDLQLCLANRNTFFFSVCNDRSSAPEADQSRDDPQKLMLLMFSLVFSRWLKHVCVTGAAV